MKTITLALTLLAVSITCSAIAQEAIVAQPDTLKWGAGPPFLPTGPQSVIISGDPTKEGPYVLRLKFPAGFKIAPHMHPNDENVTVISGMFHFGVGEKFDESKAQAVKPGGFVQAPKGVKHYAWASQETVIQLHGVGPAGVTFVNPADDPRKK
jgi:quercetin dioxygenase-like cupin family protein